MSQRFFVVTVFALSIAAAMEIMSAEEMLSVPPSSSSNSVAAKAKAVIPGIIGVTLVADGLNGFFKGALGNYFARFLKTLPKTEWVRKKIEGRSAEYQKAAQPSPKAHYVKQTLKLAAGALACSYACHVYNAGGFFGEFIKASPVDTNQLLDPNQILQDFKGQLKGPAANTFLGKQRIDVTVICMDGSFLRIDHALPEDWCADYLNSLNLPQPLLIKMCSDPEINTQVSQSILHSILFCDDLKDPKGFVSRISCEQIKKIIRNLSLHSTEEGSYPERNYLRCMMDKISPVNGVEYPTVLVTYIEEIVKQFIDNKMRDVNP